MTKINKKLIAYILNNLSNEDIKKYTDDLIKEMQDETKRNPKVYLAYLKDTRSDVTIKRNLTAKTVYPTGINKHKEIRIYIGREDEYPNINQMVKDIAKTKLIERLKREV